MEDISKHLKVMYGLSDAEAEAIGTVYESPEAIELMEKDCAELSEAFWKKHGLEDLLENLQKNPDFVVPRRSHVDEPAEYYHRYNRAFDADNFQWNYKFVEGTKLGFLNGGGLSIRSDRKCYDKTWIAVHAKDSVCMVTRRKDVDMSRVDAFYKRCCTNQQTMRSYAEAVISEVESLPYESVRQGLMFSRPFGFASLVDDDESAHEAIARFGIAELQRILFDKVNSDLDFTFDETVQTAIRAFQHLCGEELKAEDIWVTTLKISDNLFEHMPFDQRKEHLAVISSGPSSGGSGPSV